MLNDNLEFTHAVTDEIRTFPMENTWYYLVIPDDVADDFMEFAVRGFVPVTAKLGGTIWQTSLMPLGKHAGPEGSVFLAVKASVRKKERVDEGDLITVQLAIDDRLDIV